MNFNLLFTVIIIVFSSCIGSRDFKTEEIINIDECLNIISTETVFNDSTSIEKYCIVDFNQLKNIFNKQKLYYIGSDSNYHYFYLYEKISYEDNSMWRFATSKVEYTPKNEFYQIGKIGEQPFPRLTK